MNASFQPTPYRWPGKPLLKIPLPNLLCIGFNPRNKLHFLHLLSRLSAYRWATSSCDTSTQWEFLPSSLHSPNEAYIHLCLKVFLPRYSKELPPPPNSYSSKWTAATYRKDRSVCIWEIRDRTKDHVENTLVFQEAVFWQEYINVSAKMVCGETPPSSQIYIFLKRFINIFLL